VLVYHLNKQYSLFLGMTYICYCTLHNCLKFHLHKNLVDKSIQGDCFYFLGRLDKRNYSSKLSIRKHINDNYFHHHSCQFGKSIMVDLFSKYYNLGNYLDQCYSFYILKNIECNYFENNFEQTHFCRSK